jgi:hypothetical protein
MTEIERLLSGPAPDEKPQGFLANARVCAPACADRVLARSREILSIVFQQPLDDWPTVELWRSILPVWFIEACSDEISREEAERRRRLPVEERQKLAERWSVGAWVHWFKTAERQWFWWSGRVISADELLIQVEVHGFPFPAGSLKWLLVSAGATVVEIDNA